MTKPTNQHYRNPLKWGWYYIEHGGGEALTGFMTKKSAKKYLRSNSRFGYSYGLSICKHPETPKGFKKIFTFPKNSG